MPQRSLNAGENRRAADHLSKGGRAILFLILLLALGVRIGWVASQPMDQAAIERLPDQAEYLQLGRSVLAPATGHALRLFDARFEQFVYAYRTPGYPFFVAACAGNVRIIRLLQAAIDAATVLAAYWLARRWIGAGGALWTAAAVAVNPFLIYFCGLILSETLFTALLAWGFVLLAARPAMNARVKAARLIAGGVLLALAVLVKPSALALPALACGWAAVLLERRGENLASTSAKRFIQTKAAKFPYRRSEAASASASVSAARLPITSNERTLPRKSITEAVGVGIGGAAIGAILTAIVLFPWAWRNDRVLHHWIWTTTNSGITTYDGFHPGATGASDQSFVENAAALPELHREDFNEVDRERYLAGLARQWAATHPARALELAAIKIARTWSPIPLSREYGRPLYEFLAAGYAVPFDLLLLIGLFCRWPRRDDAGSAAIKIFLLLPAGYFTILCALSVGSLRYRMPVEPLLAVIVGAAIAGIVQRTSRRLAVSRGARGES